MRPYFFKTLCMMACVALVGTGAIAQQTTEKWNENDEVIIKRKGDKNTKVTVEINDNEVKVNGKPLSEFNDDNVVVRRRKTLEGSRAYSPARPVSPFRGGTLNFENDNFELAMKDESRAMLGVVTQKGEDGAKIASVSKGSAAEKAGLKEGDIITRLNDANIDEPQDLIEAVGKHKPEEKVTITYKRDKKEQKASVALGKRPGGYAQGNFNFDNNFNFDMATPGRDGLNMIWNGGSPRLGIKAQETEDGKGVKVLDVDKGSNAEKSGIKEGDVITEFDGKSVNTAGELVSGAKEAKEKSSIKVKIVRDGKPQEVDIKVPKKLKTATL